MGGQLLQGDRENSFQMDPHELKIIGIDTDDGEEHPLYDKRIKMPLDEAMVRHIMVNGVQQTVLVSVSGKGEEKTAYVVDGRRRVLHAREANRRLEKEGEKPIKVPTRAKKNMSESDQELLAVGLNEHRKDDGILLRCEKASRLSARGYKPAEVALAFGVSLATIDLWLRVWGLSNATKKAIEKGVISVTAAAKLSGLSPEEQAESIAEFAASGKKATIEETERKVRAKKTQVEAFAKPTKRELRKVIESGGVDGTGVVGEDFIRGIRFALGEINPTTIKGMKALLSGE